MLTFFIENVNITAAMGAQGSAVSADSLSFPLIAKESQVKMMTVFAIDFALDADFNRDGRFCKKRTNLDDAEEKISRLGAVCNRT